MFRLSALFVCLSGLCTAQQPPKLWWASVAANAAASSADAYTSLGMYELNPLLRGPGGAFSPAKGSLFKGGIAAASISQYFMMRKHPKMARVFEIVNFGQAAIFGYTAFHNTQVPRFKK